MNPDLITDGFHVGFFESEKVEVGTVYSKCPNCETCLVPLDHAFLIAKALGIPSLVLLFSCGECGSEWSDNYSYGGGMATMMTKECES